MRRYTLPTAALSLAMLAGVGPLQASPLLISTTGGATLFGLTFDDKDIAVVDIAGGSATSFFKATDATPNLTSSPGDTDIDALHVLSDGSFVFSVTRSGSSIAGVSFNDDDLVRYDPSSGTATKIFDGTSILPDTPSDEDVDAVFLRGNGNIVLSTAHANVLGGVAFGDDDIIEYNPVTGAVTKLFDGTALLTDVASTDEDIDAVHLLSTGEILFSTVNPGSFKAGFGGGLAFDDGDIVRYDPVANTASIFFSHMQFTSANEDINAISLVPEPGTALLALFGLAGAAMRGRRGHTAS